MNKNPTVCYQTNLDAIQRAEKRAILQLVSVGMARTKGYFRINDINDTRVKVLH